MDTGDKRRYLDVPNIALGLVLFLGVVFFIFGFVKALGNNVETSGESVNVLNASQDELISGKNNVFFDKYIGVKELMSKNPSIEYISYYDDFNDESLGFVNAFGGIGKNFLIIPGNNYEVFIRNDSMLQL